MNWKQAILEFKQYLLLERGLSKNTQLSYILDLEKLKKWSITKMILPLQLNESNLKQFIEEYAQIGISSRSQARMVSSIKSFYKYCLLEDLLKKSPADLLETPRIGKKLPIFLSIEEIDI